MSEQYPDAGLQLAGSTTGQGNQHGGIVGATHIVKNVIPRTLVLDPDQTPFLNWLWLSGVPQVLQCNNAEGLISFPEQEYEPELDTITSNGGGGGATMTIVPGVPDLYVVGRAVQFVDTGETGTVSSISGNITVARDKDSDGNAQNWTAPADGSEIILLGKTVGENDDYPEATFVHPQMRTTALQIFQDKWSMSDMMRASAENGGLYGGDWWDRETKMSISSFKRSIDRAMWNNQNYVYDKATSSGVKNKLEGILYQIRNNGGNILPYNTDTVSGTLWKEFMRQNGNHGSTNKVIFAGNEIMGDIEDYYAGKIVYNMPQGHWSTFKGTSLVKMFTASVHNLNVTVIRMPSWKDSKSRRRAVCLDEKNVFRIRFAPNKDKGSREFRMEVGLEANGKPRKEIGVLAHVAVGLGLGKSHGILEYTGN